MIFNFFRPAIFLVRATLVSYAFVFTNFAFSAAAPVPSLAVLYETIAPQIYRGNVAIYFVPFHTEGADQIDTPEWWKHCPLSKSISASGMQQAGLVSRSLRTLNPTIGIVASSKLCVALSTASFIVGNPAVPIIHTPDLDPVGIQKFSGHNDMIIHSLISARIQTGFENTVTILSGFQVPIAAAPHPVLADLQSGESAIFKNLPNGEIELLARLSWKQWKEMSDYITVKALSAAKIKRNLKVSKSPQTSGVKSS